MKRVLNNQYFLAGGFLSYNYLCYNLGYYFSKYKIYEKGKDIIQGKNS